MLRLSREGGSWKQARDGDVVVRIDARGAGVLTERDLFGGGGGGGGGGEGTVAAAAVASFAVGETGRVGVRASSDRFALERVEEVGPSTEKSASAPGGAAVRRIKAVSAEKFTPFVPGEHALLVRPRVGGNGGGTPNNKSSSKPVPPSARYALSLSKGLLADIAAAAAGKSPAAAEPTPAPSPPPRPPPPPAPAPADHIYHGLRLAQWDLSVAQRGVAEMFVKKGGSTAASSSSAPPPHPPPPPWLLERGRTTHVLVADGLTVEDAMARLRQQEQYEKQQQQPEPEPEPEQQKKRPRPGGGDAGASSDADGDENDDDHNNEPARLLALIPPGDQPVFVRQSFFVACNAQGRLVTSPQERAQHEVDVRLMLRAAADRLIARRERQRNKRRNKRLPGGGEDGAGAAGAAGATTISANAPKPPPEEPVLQPGEPWGSRGRWIEPWDERGARRTVRKLRRWYRRACHRGRVGRVPTVEEEAEAEARLLREADEDTDEDDDDDGGGGGGGGGSGSDREEDDGAAAAAAGGGSGGGAEDDEEAKEAAWRYFAETTNALGGAPAHRRPPPPCLPSSPSRPCSRRPCSHRACERRPDICLVSELLLIGELQGAKSREGNNYHRNRALAEGARVLRKLKRPLDDAESARSTLRRAGVTGAETLEKILTILREGRHPRVREQASDPSNAARACLSRAWGVSARKADEWFFSKGWSTPAQVLEGAVRGQVQLSAMQRCGLEHYDDFLRRIPREEVAEAEALVKECAIEAVAEALAERAGGGEGLRAAITEELSAPENAACLHARVLGSYVRGQSRDCGDIDVLIAVADETPVSRRQILREVPPKELMRRLLLRLRSRGWLLPDMLEQWMAAHGAAGAGAGGGGQFGLVGAGGAGGSSSLMPLLPDSSSFSGAWRGPGRSVVRRFDVKWYTRASLPTATIYFASGTRFNRQLRSYAATPPLSVKQKAARLAAAFHGAGGGGGGAAAGAARDMGNCFHLSDKEVSVAYRPPNVPLHYAGGPTTQAQRGGGSYTQAGNSEHVVGPNLRVGSEREVFEALGLEYVPPHLRELD
jgi:DNA polymerase/3'-5' exonuclease PolX